jgi:hypothetical protein
MPVRAAAVHQAKAHGVLAACAQHTASAHDLGDCTLAAVPCCRAQTVSHSGPHASIHPGLACGHQTAVSLQRGACLYSCAILCPKRLRRGILSWHLHALRATRLVCPLPVRLPCLQPMYRHILALSYCLATCCRCQRPGSTQCPGVPQKVQRSGRPERADQPPAALPGPGLGQPSVLQRSKPPAPYY